MKEYRTICDLCNKKIEEGRVWVLKNPPEYKGVDYDLCYECVNKIMEHREFVGEFK